MYSSIVSYLIKFIAVFVLCFLGGELGFLLNIDVSRITLIWPPSGIGLAAVLLFGKRMLPAFILANIALSLSGGATPFVALAIALILAIEIVISSHILKRRIEFSNSFSRMQDVIGFCFIAVPIATAIGAGLATLMLVGGHFISLSPIIIWQQWWTSGILSYLLLTPLILTWYTKSNSYYNKKQFFELSVLFLFALLCGLIVFTNIFIKAGPMTYLVFPPIIWAALRFGQRETAAMVFSFCVGAIWSTLYAQGPFRGENINETLSYIQSFILILAISSPILAVLVNERRLSEKRKDEFIGIASHELKTPLTSIKAYVQVVTKTIQKNDNKKALVYLKNTDEQLDRLGHLVSDLLNLSKIQAGKLELRMEEFSLKELVAESVTRINATTRKHTFIVKGSVSKKVYADREKIEQVINNLLANAIKYSPDADKIIITISQKNNFVEICVKDFGIGIPKDKVRQIFSRFYQVKEHSNLRIAGFGLGLYISSEIIKLHNGKIWAESEENKGSAFYFTLPINKN